MSLSGTLRERILRGMRKTTIPLPEQQPLIDLWPDAATAIGVGRSSAYSMAHRGTFPGAVRVGALWKVRTVELRRYLGLALTEAAT